MHMADALLTPAVAGVMYAASAVVAGASIVELHKEEKQDLTSAAKKLPTMAVMSALVFAGQMINYTIPGTGSSGHLCGGLLLTSVLGPWAGFLSMIVILTIQCLFFADGAGKSTLMKAALGLITVSGTITIDGLEMNRGNLADIRRRLGYVLQDSDNQMFMPTVFEDMLFGPLNYGMPRPEALVDRTLAELNLTHLKNRRNHKLSGGEKRMAAIATILAMQPKIMLMDEPSTALDPKNRRTLIRTLNALPVTKIIATHDLDLVLETCDRVLLLHDGQIAADGPAWEILRDRALLERHSLELPFCLAGVPERAKKS